MIRFAKEEDVPAIQLIAKLSLEDAYINLLSSDVRDQFIEKFYSRKLIDELIEHQNVMMADTEAGTVGFAIYQKEDDLLRIYALYILPDHQRKGTGTELLDALVNYAKPENDGIGIELESRNIPAQKFYQQAGFIAEKTYPYDLFGQPLKMNFVVKRFTKENQ